MLSEQQSEPHNGETGALGAAPAAAEASAANDPVTASAPGIQPTEIAADREETSPKADAPKLDMPKADMPKMEASKMEAPKVEAINPEQPRAPGKLMIMSPGDRTWDGDGVSAKASNDAETKPSGTRRFAAMAAMVVLATLAGAIGGAMATMAIGHYRVAEVAAAAPAKDTVLEATVARLDSDLLSLKAGLEQTGKTGMSQFNKTSDRLDRLEKAQAETPAKLAKLNDAVEKLRAAPPPVAQAVPAAAKDVTGTVTPPTTQTAAAPVPAKPEVARLPTVEGWVLRDVANGSALIEGRHGLYEVYAGDPVPGLGRVDAIRRQDGRWVVVTSKGLIVAR
jgi:hypothetical protein